MIATCNCRLDVEANQVHVPCRSPAQPSRSVKVSANLDFGVHLTIFMDTFRCLLAFNKYHLVPTVGDLSDWASSFVIEHCHIDKPEKPDSANPTYATS